MLNKTVTTDMARVLAELVDTALADDWAEDVRTMALLWESSENPDDLRIAVRRLEGDIEDELAPTGELGDYRAVAHSTVTRWPPAELRARSDGASIRITVAVDSESELGVVRHPNGATEWFGAIGLPVVELIRSALRLEPGNSG